MTTPLSQLRRIELLERQQAEAAQQLRGQLGRQDVGTGKRWHYLARTVAIGESPYPGATGDNTFGLVFLDREYTPTAGAQAVTDADRASTHQAIGRTINGQWILEGELVEAIPAPPPPGTTDKGRWSIVPLRPYYWGVLSGTLAAGSSATVRIWSLNGSNAWVDSGFDQTVWDGTLPAGESLASGTWVLLVWEPNSAGGGRWMAIPAAEKMVLVEFTLTENMGATVAGQAAATVTASSDPGVAGAITVFDPQGRWTDAITGCKGTAWRLAGAFRILGCTRAVREATATLNADMCGSAPTVTGWTPRAIGEHQVDPGAGTLANPRGHYGQSGDVVLFLRTNNAPPFTWAVVDVTLHTVDLTIDRRYHEASCQIQVLKRQIAVELCEDAPDPENDENWETELQLSEITYATGVQAASTGTIEGGATACKIQTTRAKLCGFAISDPVDPADSITLHEVEVVVDVEATSTELLQHVQPIFVICSGAVDEVQIDTIDDCPEEE